MWTSRNHSLTMTSTILHILRSSLKRAVLGQSPRSEGVDPNGPKGLKKDGLWKWTVSRIGYNYWWANELDLEKYKIWRLGEIHPSSYAIYKCICQMNKVGMVLLTSFLVSLKYRVRRTQSNVIRCESAKLSIFHFYLKAT